MSKEIHKRFKRLVSLNIEGISSNEEDLELWRILKENNNLKQEFLQVRKIHYLLKVHCDPTASETAFTNRVKNALQPGRLSEKDFTAAVQDKLLKLETKKKTRTVQLPVFQIAASIIIVLACASLYINHFSVNKDRSPELTVSENVYLAWAYVPQTIKSNSNLANLYSSQNTTLYLNRMQENPINQNIRLMNQKITRSEKLWP